MKHDITTSMRGLWKGGAGTCTGALQLWGAERRRWVILHLISELIEALRSRRAEYDNFVSLIFGSRFLDMKSLTKVFKNRNGGKHGSVCDVFPKIYFLAWQRLVWALRSREEKKDTAMLQVTFWNKSFITWFRDYLRNKEQGARRRALIYREPRQINGGHSTGEVLFCKKLSGVLYAFTMLLGFLWTARILREFGVFS
jgi:hypothetical protein